MRLKRPKIAPIIDADLAIEVIDRNINAVAEDDTKVIRNISFQGTHERTAKGDEMTIAVSSGAKRNSIKYNLKRDSLYHVLPEYLFHPLDRYAGTENDKENFKKKHDEQKKTEAEAKEYFYPFDKILNEVRIRFQQHLNDSVLENEEFIIDFITENADINKDNPFIRRCLPFILDLRAFRGSSSLIATALKTTFGVGMVKYKQQFSEIVSEIDARSCHISLDGTIDDLFCGEQFTDWVEIFYVKYQTAIISEEDICMLNDWINGFSLFFKKWFLGWNQEIKIDFGDFKKQPIINDSRLDGPLFLNYNTQLMVS